MAIRTQLLLLSALLLPAAVLSQQTLYSYFTEGGVSSGLAADSRETFTLNGKDMKIFSGALHYFRVHPDYWRDRLRKYRAAGLNAIDVYVPWNLHNPERGVFDFGDGGRDMSAFLDIRSFVQMAQEEDLFVILRPGPYICAEWEFGGMPSWILNDDPMFPRTSHEGYSSYAEDYLSELLGQVSDLQFYPDGGPIIMAQVENEYGAIGYEDFVRDLTHLRQLKAAFEDAGIEALLFTSDSPYLYNDWGSADGMLMTANFKDQGTENMDRLLELQPNRPILVSEYWSGWFDHWFEPGHNSMDIDKFEDILGDIFSYDGSVNFYMFHGGTNFNFLNGANVLGSDANVYPYYAPDVTSYDYDAPLSESGQYRDKYFTAQEMIAAYDPLADVLTKPEMPEEAVAVAFADVVMTEWIDYRGLIDNVPSSHIVNSERPVSMERLDVNGGNGQSYGYTVYRKQLQLTDGSVIRVRGHVRDLLQVMVDGVMIHDPILSIDDLSLFGSWAPRDAELVVDLSGTNGCDPDCSVDFFVENLGRANFGKYHHFIAQKKGLWEGDVLLDDEILTDWEIFAMEFKNDWVQGLTGWEPYDPAAANSVMAPRAVRGSFQVDEPADTYFDYEDTDWIHGAVFVNGFNIGRYHEAGPQQTLYIPGPLLQAGTNEIVIMDNYQSASTVQFAEEPYYGVPVYL